MYHLIRAYYLFFNLQLICALILQSVLYVIAVLCSNLPLQNRPYPPFCWGFQTVIVREALFGVPEQFGMAIFPKKSPHPTAATMSQSPAGWPPNATETENFEGYA